MEQKNKIKKNNQRTVIVGFDSNPVSKFILLRVGM